jgi:hypothetical protein
MQYVWKLYKGNIEVSFDEASHTYTIDNRKVISPTTVLKMLGKPWLIDWAAKTSANYVRKQLVVGEEITSERIDAICDNAIFAHTRDAKKATDFGKITHKWVEDYINHQLDPESSPAPEMPTDERQLICIQHFLRWAHETGVRFTVAEKKVYSRMLDVVGTLDKMFILNGNLYCGDIKTSKSISPDYWLQVAFYAAAYEEEYREPISDTCIVLLTKDGKIDVRYRKQDYKVDWRDDFRTFCKVREIYSWAEENKYFGFNK